MYVCMYVCMYVFKNYAIHLDILLYCEATSSMKNTELLLVYSICTQVWPPPLHGSIRFQQGLQGVGFLIRSEYDNDEVLPFLNNVLNVLCCVLIEYFYMVL